MPMLAPPQPETTITLFSPEPWPEAVLQSPQGQRTEERFEVMFPEFVKRKAESAATEVVCQEFTPGVASLMLQSQYVRGQMMARVIETLDLQDAAQRYLSDESNARN